MDFTGKVVLITGASSGIGAGTAKYLAKLGANLVLTGRNAENLEKIGAECESKQGAHLFLVADVTQECDNVRIIAETMEKFGRIDVLVNNAGILTTGSIEETTMQQYDELMNTNMRGVYHLTMLAVPHLIKSKGNVVNVSSVAGVRSFANILAYCVSKAALDQFTRCVALELAPKAVRVNSVNPGAIITDIHRRLGMDDATYAEFLKTCQRTHALGRPGEVSEVATAIAFLASEDSSFITGVCLPVDGGRQAMCPR